MRIQHNITALNAHRNLTNNNSAVGKNLEKLSSGYRINRAGDDAAGLAISEKMRAQITSLETGKKNAEDGISLVQTAEGALTEVHSMLNRIVELSTQAQNGTYDATDKAKMQSEVKALSDEITRIKTETKFNGTAILDGTTTDVTIHVGEGNIAVSGTDLSAVATAVDGYDISDYAGAVAATTGAKAQIDAVSKLRSDLGAVQNRLEHTINNLGTQVENLSAAESRIRDVDMAKEMMAYTKNNILVQASQAMLAQANQVPQGVLQLLQ